MPEKDHQSPGRKGGERDGDFGQRGQQPPPKARLKWLARQQTGQQLSISPLSVDELTETEGDQVGTGEGRSHLAAEIARTGRAIAWPPARNDTCWCGSGRKYKKCCGPVPPAEDDEP